MYEVYSNGNGNYKPVADRCPMRISRWMKSVAQHGHFVATHKGPCETAFAKRLKADIEAVDTIMFQERRTRDEKLGRLAAGIKEQIWRSPLGWQGSAVFAEYGFDHNLNRLHSKGDVLTSFWNTSYTHTRIQKR